MRNIILTICIAFSAFSCGTKISASDPLFVGNWVLSELNGVPVQTSGTRKDAGLQFSYSDKKVTGNGGCNRLMSTYELGKKKKLTLGEFAGTKMACPDSKFEDAFLNALRTVNCYDVDGNTGDLLLKKNNDVVAKFTHR